MDKAAQMQLVAIFFSLGGWCIALTEIYHDAGQIPVVFASLILISVLIINSLAQSLGILIGYRALDKNG